MDFDEKLARIREFQLACLEHQSSRDEVRRLTLRKQINQTVRAVRRDVIEAGCHKVVTIGPPPAVGGLIMRDADPFDLIFERPYGMSLVPMVSDMLDQTIGVLSDPVYREAQKNESTKPTFQVEGFREGFVFIAMPMAGENPTYDDVHDAIKNAAASCSLQAERVDEVQDNERITDRLLESIRKAEYVVADLTDGRPNVFYEAGYAFGIGKTPIYIARKGTKLEFDIKDYPVIFFDNMRSLRERLQQRFSVLIQARRATKDPAP